MPNCRLLLAICLLFAATANADIVTMVGSGDTSAVGNTVTASLRISGLGTGTAPALGGFDVDVLYNPAVLQFIAASFVDPATSVNQLDFPEVGSLGFLGQAFDTGSVIDAFGVSGNSAAVLESNQVGDFVFLTLSFRALATQQATVSLNLLDPNLLFSDAVGTSMTASYGNVSTEFSPNVAPVPEPASWVLLLAVAVPVVRLARRLGVRP